MFEYISIMGGGEQPQVCPICEHISSPIGKMQWTYVASSAPWRYLLGYHWLPLSTEYSDLVVYIQFSEVICTCRFLCWIANTCALKKNHCGQSLFRSAKSLSCYIRTGLEYVRYPKSWCSWSSLVVDTVDGRNPAPVDKWFIPLIIGFQPYKVMQDFFHPQFDSWWFIIDSWSSIYFR